MSNGISTKEMMKTLSDDAKALLGGYFGPFGIPGRSKLSFGLQKSRPTDRAQAALDELVAAGAMVRSDLKPQGVEYTVQVNCSEFGRWLDRNKSKGKWSATEPVTPAHVGRDAG